MELFGSRAALARLQLWLGCVFLVTFVGLSIWARFPVFYRDDWDWLLAVITRPISLRTIFTPHNEHLIPLPRLLLALQFGIEGPRSDVLFALGVLSQLIVGWLFWREIRRRWFSDPTTARFVTGLTWVLLFFSYQLQSTVFMAAILFPLVQMFMAVAAVCWVNASAQGGRVRAAWVTASIAAALGAALTTTNGFAAPCALAVSAAMRRCSWRVVLAFAVSGGLCLIGYLMLVGRPALEGTAQSMWTVDSLRAMFVFFLSFLGSGLVYGSGAASPLVGMALLGIGAWCVRRVAVLGDAAPRIEHFAVALLLFAVASAAMASPARAQFGTIQVAQSRYATFTLVYWSGLILCVVSRVSESRRWRDVLPAVMVGTVSLGMVLLLAQLFLGLVWKAKADNIGFAGLALAAGVDDEAWIATLHPNTAVVRMTRDRLRGGDKGDFSDPAIGRRLSLSQPAAVCGGMLTLMAATPGPGFRVSARLDIEGGKGVVLDRDGTVVGVARPAPLVNVPNPPQLDVVSAVWRSLLTGTSSDRTWSGFAQVGGGAPYQLHVLDRTGQSRCRAQ